MPFGLGFFATAGAGAAGSFDLLETQVLGSSTASVTFSSLGTYSNYKHLQLRMVNTLSSQTVAVRMEFNADTASNYSSHRIVGNGSSVSSSAETSVASMFVSIGALTPTASVTDILDAFDTNKFKTLRSLAGGMSAANEVLLTSGNWRSTNALTSIKVFPTSFNFVSGSRFSLYGLKGS
jgi:hypothetical protein